MKRTTLVIAIGALSLTACDVSSSNPPSHQEGHVQRTSEEGRALSVQDQSTTEEVVFTVKEGESTFTDYGVSHTKPMHLIVVRDDLQHFHHLHPERDAGVWSVPFKPASGGTYRLYADFVEEDGSPHTLKFERVYTGDRGDYGITKDPTTVKTVDRYTVRFTPSVSGDEVIFAYDITDKDNQQVKLEEYLGATGHSVLISPSGDFIHTHPSNQGNAPVFRTIKLANAFYRVFTQFKIKGEVRTVMFDWEP